MLPGELRHSLDARWQDIPELTKDAADHVHDLGTLADNQIPRTMNGKYGLLVLGLDLDETHGWAARCFADRLGIRRIGLVALHIGLT